MVVGAGPGGLAMSHQLTGAGVDHVLLERGEVANSWRTERWDSLRLLTPNWMTALPGARYEGDDPHGYMTAAADCRRPSTDTQSFGPRCHRDRGRGGGPHSDRIRGTDDQAGSGGAMRSWRPRAGRASLVSRCSPWTFLGRSISSPRWRTGDPDRSVRWPSPGGGCVGIGGPDRRRAARGGPRGHVRRGRTRSVAPVLPGPRHLLVAGPDRPTRRAVGRGGGPPARPPSCLGTGGGER